MTFPFFPGRSRWAGFAILGFALGTGTALAQRPAMPDAQKNPLAGNRSAVAAGAVLYRQTCQACHGGEARGDRGPALASGNFSHGGEDGELFQTIRNGVPGTQMPA